MLNIRKAEERGHSDLGWLQSHHTFSFSDYYDPRYMGFGVLRVINEDTVQAGRGFGTHPHRDMEIISYVLDGALEHRDSMGNGSVIRPGDVQRMSAGTGVTHSEFNHSSTDPVHFLQIWILPNANGHPPGYEQKHYGEADKRGKLCLVASGDGREDSVSLNQDADIYAAILGASDSIQCDFRPGRDVWMQVARGGVMLDGHRLEAGDGASLSQPQAMVIEGVVEAEVLIFDMVQTGRGGQA